MYTTKVVTMDKNSDKYQYFHHHASLADVRVNVNNNQCLEIVLELDKKYVSYPLTNVERFETEQQKVRR